MQVNNFFIFPGVSFGAMKCEASPPMRDTIVANGSERNSGCFCPACCDAFLLHAYSPRALPRRAARSTIPD
eukprot:5355729-Pleurochrysis_carterae.AAC.1